MWQAPKLVSQSMRLLVLAVLGLTVAIVIGSATRSPLQASEDVVTAATPNGSWIEASFPVENFQAYTSPFGYRRSPTNPNVRQFHNGLDLAAPMGSYIRNWWAGEIVELSDHTACGTMVIIRSGDWKHIYCHLQGRVHQSAQGTFLLDRGGGIQLWMGQQVPTGARIGRIGMTGRTTGPHLHWGLKYSDRYIDPALVLQAMYKQQTAYN